MQFSGVLTLTHSASLQLPGSANITTAAGDVFGFRCLSSGVWVLVSGSRYSDPTKAPLISPSFSGVARYGGVEIGFRGVPQVPQNANYTFVASDAGLCRLKTDANPYTFTINTAIHTQGDVLTVMNAGTAGAITITPGAGFTLTIAGTTTTGARTLAINGLATIYLTASNAAIISGAGIS